MITIEDVDKYSKITLIVMILTISIFAIENIIPNKNNNFNKKIEGFLSVFEPIEKNACD